MAYTLVDIPVTVLSPRSSIEAFLEELLMLDHEQDIGLQYAIRSVRALLERKNAGAVV